MNTGNEFWTDRVDRLKEVGKNDEIIKICMKNIPLPAAFREMVMAIRRQIQHRRKEKQPYNDLLDNLYQAAVWEGFFENTLWRKLISLSGSCLIAQTYLPDITYDYKRIGYQFLSLLVVKDIKWITEKWGEPECHQKATALNDRLFKKVNEHFEKAGKKEMKKLGYPSVSSITESIGEKEECRATTRASNFVLAAIIVVILFVIAVTWK